ncbi:ATPase [Actinomyces glycerinitolerans]|uniref:ATPase n=1 Tax=Actinomyces glycerinitolerans TaxID=1892869 RepID=A0A1M4RVR3_9ACTO|nr:ATPase [Actinomyces glycerinitolerans]SHE24073.1 Hypothetical protein ACGLYG10_0271 [Actinomyces glycerinitolerans]
MTTRADAGDDLLRILDELDELVSTARSLPMSSSAIVGRQEALDLIDRAREAVPTAVHRAEEIVADADAVLAQGREESRRILNHAQEEAERLVAGENIVRMANDRADAIISTAEERAARLRHGADDYSDRSLAALQAEIDKLAEQVQAGRDALAARLETAANDAAAAEREQQEANRHFAGWSVDPAATRNWSKGGR